MAWLRNRPRCKRYVKAGGLSRNGAAGAQTIAFSGKVSGRRLAPARYRLTIVAVDAAGNRSDPVIVTFTVVKPRS